MLTYVITSCWTIETLPISKFKARHSVLHIWGVHDDLVQFPQMPPVLITSRPSVARWWQPFWMCRFGLWRHQRSDSRLYRSPVEMDSSDESDTEMFYESCWAMFLWVCREGLWIGLCWWMTGRHGYLVTNHIWFSKNASWYIGWPKKYSRDYILITRTVYGLQREVFYQIIVTSSSVSLSNFRLLH